jgi:predicted metal-dependent phosphoesterase TrpH
LEKGLRAKRFLRSLTEIARTKIMISASLHIHTKYSPDSPTEPKDIVKEALRLKLDAVGVTDHYTTKGASEVRKIAKEEAKNLIVLIGQEVKTEYGDLLVFGTSENLKPGLFSLLDKAKAEQLLTILPHPFDARRKRSAIALNMSSAKLEKAANKLDAVEVFNSRCFLPVYNKEAEDFADAHKLPGIAGSDAHILEELDNARNTINCGRSEEEIYKAIRQGKAIWRAKRTSVFSYLKRYF